MKKLIKAAAVAFVITTVISMIDFTAECRDISDKVLRFHILANSDTQEDQDLKLKVRDAVLEYSEELFANADSKESAESIAADHINDIVETAQKEVFANGYSYEVKGCITKMYFTTRKYENFTLPAGQYDAVRLLIGKGDGHNWWCVMFPMLCVPCAEKQASLDDVLDENEVDIVEGGDEYEFKFKIVEIFESIADWINDF